MKRNECYPQNLFEELCDSNFLRKGQVDTLERLVSRLPSLQRAAIGLRFGRKLTFTACARELNISVNAFKALLESALQYLRKPENIQSLFFENKGLTADTADNQTPYIYLGKCKGEMIRNLSDNELAKFLNSICPEYSACGWYNWLNTKVS